MSGLNEFFQIHKGMKLNVTVKLAVQHFFDEGQEVVASTRSYTIINSDELKHAPKNMRQDIETRILEMALYQAGLMIAKVSEIHFTYRK